MNLLVLLVGANSIANYALIEYFKSSGDDIIPRFDAVLLIYTIQTKQIVDRIKELKNEIMFYDIGLEEKEKRDIDLIKTSVTNAISQIDISSIHLNYTGATKSMSIGTYLAINDYCKINDIRVINSDISPTDYTLTLDNQKKYPVKGSISDKLNIPIKDFYILHGLTYPTFKKEVSKFYKEDFCIFLLEEVEKNRQKFYENLWDKENIQELDWKKSLPSYVDVEISNTELKELQKFIRGRWIEEYLFDCLQEIKEDAHITDLAWNIEAKNRDKEFEIDVIVISGYKSYVFSCTTDQKASHLKSKAFEVSLRSEQLAGRSSNCILIALADKERIKGVKEDMNHIEKSFNAIGIDDIRDKKSFKKALLTNFV